MSHLCLPLSFSFYISVDRSLIGASLCTLGLRLMSTDLNDSWLTPTNNNVRNQLLKYISTILTYLKLLLIYTDFSFRYVKGSFVCSMNKKRFTSTLLISGDLFGMQ